MEVVVLDLETTGLDAAAGDRIVEIGAARYVDGMLIEEFESLVNPLRPISPGASRVNGITDEMVADAPTIDEVLPELLRFIGDSTIVIHNAEFDLSFLAVALNDSDLGPLDNDVICTLRLARRVLPGPRDYRMESLIRDLQLHVVVGHRALADAHAAWALVRALLAQVARDEERTVGEVIRLQGGPVPWPMVVHGQIQGRTTAQDWINTVDLPEPFRSAIREGRTLDITYQKANGEITERKITPLSAYERGPHTYLVAFCHLRQQERTFRMDRILDVS